MYTKLINNMQIKNVEYCETSNIFSSKLQLFNKKLKKKLDCCLSLLLSVKY